LNPLPPLLPWNVLFLTLVPHVVEGGVALRIMKNDDFQKHSNGKEKPGEKKKAK
jgi:hypothetical protein